MNMIGVTGCKANNGRRSPEIKQCLEKSVAVTGKPGAQP